MFQIGDIVQFNGGGIWGKHRCVVVSVDLDKVKFEALDAGNAYFGMMIPYATLKQYRGEWEINDYSIINSKPHHPLTSIFK